jgi:CRP-like cAMP-binding protein
MKFSNRILRALGADTLDALRPWLELVSLRADQVIFRMSEPVEHVYFIEGGLVLHLAMIEDGRTVSVGVTGREGAVGVPNALSGRPSFHQVAGHVEGAALRIEAARFAEIVNASKSARRLMDSYLEALIVSSDLMTTCLAFHPLSARLGTALLNAQDANGNHKVLATQELLASMFAVQRTSVTSLATSMERSGLIRTGRGAVEILDRPGLERAACGCYHRQSKLWADLWSDLGEER